MAKKIRPVTKLTMALPTLLMGKGVTTAFDYTRGKFLGTSKDVESLTDFSKRHNNLINEMQRRVSRKDIETYNRLCQEYNRKLVDKGYGMKRSVFKKLDFIDLRSLPVNNDGNGAQMPTFRILSEADYSDYISRIFSENVSEDTVMDNALCLLIPPFTELGFCFTPQRYGYMKVKEIDMVAHTIDITVQDYTVRHDTSLWVPGTRCDARISLLHERPASVFDMNSYIASIDTSNATDPHGINKFIPLSEFNWSKREEQIWQTVDNMYSKPTMDALAEAGRSSYVELVRYILLACVVSNYILYANKPVLKREPKKQAPAAVKDEAAAETKPLPERRTRTVGLITVKSVKTPKRATPNTVRKWKVASWKARGGIRHMADGRVIPFKESIRHRKALLEKDASKDVLPVTLKMKDNRPSDNT